MKEFLEPFSNREISIVFWSLLILVVAFFLNITASISLIKSFFVKKLTYIYCAMAMYLSVIVYFLSSIGLWETSLFKDFLFWILTSAFVMLFSINKLKNNNDFKNFLLKLLTINIILEFIASNYNFSLIKELLLVPSVTFLSILIIVAQQKKNENEKVIKLLNLVSSYIGLTIFFYVIYRLIKSPSELFTVKNLKSFLLAPLLTILFIPFIFLVTVYSKYEGIFININRYNFLSAKRKSQIKFSFLKFAHLNLKYLNNAHNITLWRKAELLNEEKINLYIKNEIKNDVKFRG